MFLENKYSRWYFNIVANPDTSRYVEKHHIIPKSLGGSNDPDNIVKLSLRQHYIVHRLLPKMVISPSHRSKMLFALRCMLNYDKYGRRYKPSSRVFETLKTQIRESKLSDEHRANIKNSQVGKSLSEKHKRAISNGLLGRTHSSVTRALISKSNRGKKRSDITRKRISCARSGRPLTEKCKTAISAALKGRKVSAATCLNIKRSQEKFIYTITSSNGEFFTTANLKDWCKMTGHAYSSFSAVSRNGGRVGEWTISRKYRG